MEVSSVRLIFAKRWANIERIQVQLEKMDYIKYAFGHLGISLIFLPASLPKKEPDRPQGSHSVIIDDLKKRTTIFDFEAVLRKHNCASFSVDEYNFTNGVRFILVLKTGDTLGDEFSPPGSICTGHDPMTEHKVYLPHRKSGA